MNVLFINNDGGGFADKYPIDGTVTVREFFRRHMGIDARPDDYLIQVNRAPTSSDYVLKDGDRISVTPTKIEGADGD